MGKFIGSNLGILGSPYFWGLLSAVFLGLYVALMIYHPKDTVDRSKARSRRKLWGPISLVLPPLMLLLGLFFFPAPAYLSIEFSILWGASVLIATLGFRFPKSVGIPTLLLGVLMAVGFFITLQDWVPVSGPRDLLQVELWEGGDSGGRIRYSVPGREPWYTNPSPQLNIGIEKLQFPVYGSLTGAELWLRPFPRETGQGSEGFRQGEDLFHLLGWITLDEVPLPELAFWENWSLEVTTQGYFWRSLGF